MQQVLYEPSSIREDSGILYLTEHQMCILPFIFELTTTDKDGNKVNQKIPENDIIKFTIKEHSKLVTPVICKQYTGIKSNIGVLRLSTQDMNLLVGGNEYILSIEWVMSDSKQINVLLKQLPIRIQEVC